MPQNLTALSLDFGNCDQITDVSVKQLANNMLQNLTSLSLGFRLCRRITDASVQHLAGRLPQNLTSRVWILRNVTKSQTHQNMPTVISERTIVKTEVAEVLYSDWAYIISFTFLSLVQEVVVHSIFVVIIFAMSGLRWTMFPSIYLWTTLLAEP
eukprot:s1648_g11.t1